MPPVKDEIGNAATVIGTARTAMADKANIAMMAIEPKQGWNCCLAFFIRFRFFY